MPSSWLEEEVNSSPPYSPQYSPPQTQLESQSNENGDAIQVDPGTKPTFSNQPVDMLSTSNSQCFLESDRATVKDHEAKSRMARTQVHSSSSNLDFRGLDTSSVRPQVCILPSGVGLGFKHEVDSDLDSLFGDSEARNRLIDNSQVSESCISHQYDRNHAMSAKSKSGVLHSAEVRTYPSEIEQLARLRFEQDFRRPESQDYANYQSEEHSPVTGEGVQNVEPISQLEDNSCRSTENPLTIRTDLTQNPEEVYHNRGQEAGLYTPDIPVAIVSPDEGRYENCQGNLDCTCRPTECRCAGCDHSAEIDAMMQLYWHEDVQTPGCGCGGDRGRCACLPGLCHCDKCREHAQTESSVDHQTADTHRSRNFWPDPPPSPFKWRDVFPGGRKILDDTGNWIIKSSSPPIPWKIVQRFDTELPSKLQNVTREERETAIREFYRGSHSDKSHQGHEIASSKMPDADIGSSQANEVTTCSCSTGGTCTCTPDTCRCAGLTNKTTPPNMPVQAAQLTNNESCSCTCGGTCQCDPGYCQCGPSSNPLSTGTIRDGKSVAVSEESCHTPRRHISVSELVGVLGHKTLDPKIVPCYDYQPQIPPSRPDTPRPAPDSCPSTPYASEIRPNPFDRRLDGNFVRQSVEPEAPITNWQRESTPAYEDRSLTPSPVSRRGDIDMLDSPYNQGSVPALPPVDLSTIGTSRSISPPRPPLPPIPATLSALKVAKRDERHKSGVQGSKIDKRSVTSSPTKAHARSKSRSITKKINAIRQPQPTVEDLTEQRHGLGGSQNPGVANGRVAAAVAVIEAQVNRQQEDQNAKQKDGTPVRRSQRRNKGVRTSLGSNV